METILIEREVSEPWAFSSRNAAGTFFPTISSSKEALGQTPTWNNILTQPRRTASTGILTCDFRRLQQQDQQRQRDLEFKRFAESGVGSWRVEDGEGMCGGFAEMQDARHGLDDMNEQRRSQSSVPNELHPITLSTSSGLFEQESGRDRSGFWNDFAHLEESWSSSQTLAAQRLQQICHHIEQTLTPSHHLLQSIHDPSSHPDNIQTTYFSCPHEVCHSRLARINANLSHDWKTRPCPHSGCGYVSQTVDQWVAHCTTSAHSHPTACSWCRSAEDTRALWH